VATRNAATINDDDDDDEDNEPSILEMAKLPERPMTPEIEKQQVTAPETETGTITQPTCSLEEIL